MIRVVLSLVLPAALLLGAYAAAPLDPAKDPLAGVMLLVGMVVFTVVLILQVRRVMRAERPVVVALSAIAVFVPLLLVVFAYAYALLAQQQPGSFNEPLSRVDAFYFTTSTFATVGFGDIHPTSDVARIVVTIQIVINLIVVGGLIRAFMLIARRHARIPEFADENAPSRLRDARAALREHERSADESQ